jgi:hypothetical protein
MIAVGGCASAGSVPSQPPIRPVTERAANGRFTVTLTAGAIGAAEAVGVSLPPLVARALNHINALLPGPPTDITIGRLGASQVIPQTGTFGSTNPVTGLITIGFGPTSQVSPARTLRFWLPRSLSHEVDHSVRIIAGPGAGVSLLQLTITEGISSVFDLAAFPGPPSPSDRAISRSQECALWKRAQPLLADFGLYDQWMFGGGGVPHWTGFTIGYDIVSGYMRHHPHTTWAAVTAASADTILAGSHYQPCSS